MPLDIPKDPGGARQSRKLTFLLLLCSTRRMNGINTERSAVQPFSLSSLNPNRVAHQGTQAIKRSAQHHVRFPSQ